MHSAWKWSFEFDQTVASPLSAYCLKDPSTLTYLSFYHHSLPPVVMSSSSSSGVHNEAPMPPANSDLATTWAFLEEGVDHIMTKLHTGVSYSKYMSLYTVSYNYCTSSRLHGNMEQSAGLGGRSMCHPSTFCNDPRDLTASALSSWREFDGFRLVQ